LERRNLERSNPERRSNRFFVHAALVFVLLSAAGCKKKITPPPPPPPPPPAAPAPTAQISASPTAVVAGGAVVLNWTTTNAANAAIDGIGSVSTSGTTTVTPTVSTNYHLLAKGAGGSAEASVRVTVSRPPPPPPVVAPVSSISPEEEFKANVQDIFFDYDKYSLNPGAQATLSQDASYFTSHPNVKILIAGNCDERGSAEYNIALGENRAAAAKKALVDAGVDASRIRVISYGKEKPICTESSEACYQKNRRDGFSLDR